MVINVLWLSSPIQFRQNSLFHRLVFIFLCLFANFHAFADIRDDRRALILEYAEAVGAIRVTERLTVYLAKKCEIDLTVSPTLLNAVDYFLRSQTGYNYDEFVNFVGADSETDELVKESAEKILLEVPDCAIDRFSPWHSNISAIINSEIEKIREFDLLWELPRKHRNETEIRHIFERKLAQYDVLPDEEISELSSALEYGVYRYASGSNINIKKNIQAAIKLREYIADSSSDPHALYALAKTQQKIDRSLALKSFKEAAEIGYPKAQIWLGTYYGCNNEKIKALFWLNKAVDDDAQIVNLIKSEIEDLGMPTDCQDGWVY